ncbi:acyl-CoA-binding domain-containing protein 5 [Elysia marginata]|uniref:Acyl-CoA-binding domain-containing protein 5 n=1 Tax=Elysia marginata TaxID=1093978 RepID=A0AAV4HQP7_9GAST|nr:acyl-CoA-binding domain-containing protein 5 [Elysia marginata]
MPQTDDVSEFLQKLDNFYEMVEDSDNHNSLKVYNKQTGDAAHSNSSDSGNLEQSFDQSLNGSEYESEFEHSRGITKLLQQDIRWWQDRTGVLRAHKANGDIKQEPRGDEPYQPFNGKPSLQNYEVSQSQNRGVADEIGTSHPASQPVSEGETNPPNTPGTPGTEEEWEEVEARASNSGSHSGQSGGSASDSETENEEEFCDTSDEPAETIHPQEASADQTGVRASAAAVAMTMSSASSVATPVIISSITASSALTTSAAAKSVHFDECDNAASTSQLMTLRGSSCPPTREGLSDSLLVNPSPTVGSVLDVTSSSLADVSVGGQTGMRNTYDTSVGAGGRLDITLCRGGDSEDGERDRQGRAGAGGRSGRDGLPSGRGGVGFSSGAGSSGSRRGLFPEPGGGGGGGRRGPGFPVDDRSPADLNEQIVVTLLRLQHDMSGVLNRLNSLEALVKEGRAGWWPLSELSFKSALLIFGWPLLIQVILFYLSRRRRRHSK